MRYFVSVILICCIAIGFAFVGKNDIVISVDRPVTNVLNSYYIGNKAPLKPLAFVKLPVGSIRPEGWIKKYLELQRDGLSGHLGEISAWLKKDNNAWLSKDGKGEWGWEEVPYWLKGYAGMAYLLKDPKMLAEVKIWIDGTIKSQQPNGFFGPQSVTDKKTLDLWANMIMLWTLQDYYDYSNDKRIITLMTNYFKWELSLPDSMLLETYWENSRGGDNLYSIFWLYNHTGEKWLLDLAHKMHKNTADWSQKNTLPNWHNVNIAQCFREPATYFMLTGDSSHLKATYNDFQLVRDIYGQVPGGMFGGDENCRPGFSDPRQGTETCGFVEQMASDELLVGFTGDPMWADQCENVAFNSYPAALMSDFKALRYITSPNHVVSDSKNHSPGIQNEGPFLMMNPFSSRCCQHNHSQGWPYYAEHLWMASNDNGIVAMLYNSCEVKVKVSGGNEATIIEKTNYPFEENVIFEVRLKNIAAFPMYFRIPAWCQKASMKINGQEIEGSIITGKYAKVIRKWHDGDKIELALPMELSVKTWEKNKNSVSVNYGPLTFSLFIQEKYVKMESVKTIISDSKWQEGVNQEAWPSYEIYANSPWNYGLVFDKNNLSNSFTIEHRSWPADNFPFTTTSVPMMIKVKGKRIPGWGIDDTGLCAILPVSPVYTNEPLQDIELIPMGAARLRISAFPVIHE